MNIGMKGNNVIITDASQRVALELTRALGEKGIKVLCVERECFKGPILSASSKYSCGLVKIPDYTSDVFIELCKGANGIFPVSTNTIISVYEKAFNLFPEKFLLPSKESFYQANTKTSAIGVARDVGVPCPNTEILKNEEGKISLGTLSKFNLPVVIKLADDEGLYLEPKERYGIARTEDEIEEVVNRLKLHKKDLLIQEYVSGIGIGWSAIYDRESLCQGGIVHQRLREYPISGGPSSYCMSIKDEKAVEYGKKILNKLKWNGPAMVEFRKEANGDLKFLEINPRYWGSLPLARLAGMNIPFIHYQIIHGENKFAETKYRENVRLKFRGMDFISGLQEIRKNGYNPCDAIKLLCGMMNPGIPDGIFSLKDPIPGIAYLWKKLIR